jgi:heptosyltransferase-3
LRRLIIRPGAIGDCILSFPALEHLVTDYTEIWAPSAVLPLIHFASSTHSLVSTGINLHGVGDLQPSNELREKLQSFDSVVSWYGSNREEFRSAFQSINPNCEFHAALPRDFGLHAIDFYASQVGAPLGLIPKIQVNNVEFRDRIVIHPFSGSKKKNWPLARFRELAAQLPLPVEWLAGPEEELPEAHRFENLSELAGFIAGARLYIGNDSGITHLAAAVGVKTLAIFGPASPRIWIPRGENVEVIAVRDLAEVKPTYVARVVNRLLDSP